MSVLNNGIQSIMMGTFENILFFFILSRSRIKISEYLENFKFLYRIQFNQHSFRNTSIIVSKTIALLLHYLEFSSNLC